MSVKLPIVTQFYSKTPLMISNKCVTQDFRSQLEFDPTTDSFWTILEREKIPEGTLCVVCGDLASGIHYSVASCNGWWVISFFFLKSIFYCFLLWSAQNFANMTTGDNNKLKISSNLCYKNDDWISVRRSSDEPLWWV